MTADPKGNEPNLAIQKDPRGPGEVYWFHFDLFSSDLDREVKRLSGLGATIVQPAREGFDYITLADPEGNPFDVLTEVITRRVHEYPATRLLRSFEDRSFSIMTI